MGVTDRNILLFLAQIEEQIDYIVQAWLLKRAPTTNEPLVSGNPTSLGLFPLATSLSIGFSVGWSKFLCFQKLNLPSSELEPVCPTSIGAPAPVSGASLPATFARGLPCPNRTPLSFVLVFVNA